ncbi:MAG: sodium:proton antiporter, partial [Flavobacteriales bacterium]|nr:sodium:proton antiporter [Flavobacteriales bacterium]
MCNKKITLPIALTPIVLLIFLLIINIIIFDSSISIAGQLSLIISSIITIFIGLQYKIKWQDILHAIKKNIKTVIPALILLLLIGGLSGTWLISGIIPAMIFY